jgi:hypothetical protein
MPRFFQDANSGLLPSSRRATATQVTGDFFIQAFNRRGWMISAPPLRGGFNSDIFSERIAVALGSEENRGQFVLLERNLNELKKNRMLHMLLSPLCHEYITTNVPGWSSSGYFTIRETSKLSFKEIPCLSISSCPSFEIWLAYSSTSTMTALIPE